MDLPPNRAELAGLIEQLLERAAGGADAAERIAALLAGTRVVVSELDLQSALVTIAEVARELVAADFAAIGVISPDGQLERFIHLGIDAPTAARIGAPPTGRGILGAVIRERRAIRLDDLSRDPRAVGFPASHPAMRSFIGVPVRVGGTVFGNIYLSHAEAGVFDETDERIVRSLADLAGTAVANARLYEDARLAQRWIAASEEINQGLLSGEIADGDVTPIASHAVALADAAFVGLLLPGSTRFAAQFGPLSYNSTAMRDPAFLALPGAIMRAIEHGADAAGLAALEAGVSAGIGGFGPTMLLAWGEAEPEGALVVARGSGAHGFTAAERQMAERFVRSVSIARALSQVRVDRERLALTDERDRIARDLHDHVIQSLFGVGLGLQSVLAATGGQTRARVAVQIDAIDAVIRQIRQTIFELGEEPSHADYSQKQRLNQLVRLALEGEAIDSSVDFSGPVDTLLDSELGEQVEAVLREALSNVVRHARASRVDIAVAVSAGEVRVIVTDNGRGLGRPGRRSGLDNLLARASARGGSFVVAAKAPSGTTLEWRTPL
ncbi:MAG: GAF domain-containing protein [Microbacteriaceae bacterium]